MSWRYFDLDAPGWSMAEHLAAGGFVIVPTDHSAIGESPVPDDPWTLKPLEALFDDEKERVRGAKASGSGPSRNSIYCPCRRSASGEVGKAPRRRAGHFFNVVIGL
jgi:hypothetical protein